MTTHSVYWVAFGSYSTDILTWLIYRLIHEVVTDLTSKPVGLECDCLTLRKTDLSLVFNYSATVIKTFITSVLSQSSVSNFSFRFLFSVCAFCFPVDTDESSCNFVEGEQHFFLGLLTPLNDHLKAVTALTNICHN